MQQTNDQRQQHQETTAAATTTKSETGDYVKDATMMEEPSASNLSSSLPPPPQPHPHNATNDVQQHNLVMVQSQDQSSPLYLFDQKTDQVVAQIEYIQKQNSIGGESTTSPATSKVQDHMRKQLRKEEKEEINNENHQNIEVIDQDILPETKMSFVTGTAATAATAAATTEKLLEHVNAIVSPITSQKKNLPPNIMMMKEVPILSNMGSTGSSLPTTTTTTTNNSNVFLVPINDGNSNPAAAVTTTTTTTTTSTTTKLSSRRTTGARRMSGDDATSGSSKRSTMARRMSGDGTSSGSSSNKRSMARRMSGDGTTSGSSNNNKRSMAQRRMSGDGALLVTTTSQPTMPAATSRLRVYKSNTNKNKWVTREIAALEFLLGIPMQSEGKIVHQGFLQQQEIAAEVPIISTPGGGDNNNNNLDDIEESVTLEPPNRPPLIVSTAPIHQGRWWEKWINNPNISRHSGSEFISRKSGAEELELEQPPSSAEANNNKPPTAIQHQQQQQENHPMVPVVHAPGRRLQGDEATRVQIPLTADTSVMTRQRNVARMAITREWELKVAHGISQGNNDTTTNNPTNHVHPPMLDGRLFMSASGSYPHQVFSLLRYEPKKEEAARRRQKLEARGGGGTQFFIMPMRDWRGISYRALLPPRNANPTTTKNDNNSNNLVLFDRFASSTTPSSATTPVAKSKPNDTKKKNTKNKSSADAGGDGCGDKTATSHDDNDDDDDDAEADDEEEEEGADTYVAGLLDDPEMVQGRHRTVMIGDVVTGCIVSSTIQFVKPTILKADLNKQFRERFDGWEPPKSQRKYIGARVIDGVYTLLDPSDATENNETGTVATTTSGDESNQQTLATASVSSSHRTPPRRHVSFASPSASVDSEEGDGAAGDTTIRMPPSLTLSKIRSLKRQALLAAVKAKLELSTVALAIVYFERLCLDCRVDKSNRRLSFAACLLLAIKINESHVGLVMNTKKATSDENSNSKSKSIIESFVRPNKKSSQMFSSILEFFIQDWNISLKHLFAAEWGVLASLQFRLHAKPSQVSFHFKRLMKSLEWNPRLYLGSDMYDQWQDALATEEFQRQEKEDRRAMLKEKKEQKKLKRLQRELEAANRLEDDESSNPVAATSAGGGSSVAKDSMKEESTKGQQQPDTMGPLKETENVSSRSINSNSSKQNKTTEAKPIVTDLGGKLFDFSPAATFSSPKRTVSSKSLARSGIGGVFNRFSGGKRSMSSEKLYLQGRTTNNNNNDQNTPSSPNDDDNASMPPAIPSVSSPAPGEPSTNAGGDDNNNNNNRVGAECIINIDHQMSTDSSDNECSIPSGDEAIGLTKIL